MNPPTLNRTFLSYARGDDEPFVKNLHADLTVWHNAATQPLD